MKYITAILITLLTVGTWLHIGFQVLTDGAGYKQQMVKAAEFEERGLYTKAIDAYLVAYDEATDKQRFAISLNIVDCYERLGDMDSFEEYCRQTISSFPKQQECYKKLISYYQEKEKFDMLIPLLEEAMGQFPKEDWYQTVYTETEKSYVVTSLGYDDMTDWLNNYLSAKTMNADEDGEFVQEYQIMSDDGSIETEGLCYPALSMTDDSITSFLVQGGDGRWKMVNDKEYEIENNLNASFAAIGVLHEGYAWAQLDDKYHLINSIMETSKKEYDWIGTIQDGYTAVKQGDKWALFSIDDMEACTEYRYTDIKLDEFQRSYVNGYFLGSMGSGYSMFDKKGKQIGNLVFEDAKVCVGSQPAAVKMNGKWGFVGKNGEMYIEPQYEEACSFSNGYAAVKQDGKWGYINKYNEMVVEPQFYEAKSIGNGGGAPVKNEAGYWDMLWMYTVMYKQGE